MVKVKELGHLVLYVRALERSVAFYRDVLGWPQISLDVPGGRLAAFSSGRTHHELLLIELGHGAAPLPSGPRLGLYHFGVKVGDSDDDLRAALARLEQAGVAVVGMSDHTITHSLYVRDPDGNEVELYVDVAGVDWRSSPELLVSAPRPLNL